MILMNVVLSQSMKNSISRVSSDSQKVTKVTKRWPQTWVDASSLFPSLASVKDAGVSPSI